MGAVHQATLHVRRVDQWTPSWRDRHWHDRFGVADKESHQRDSSRRISLDLVDGYRERPAGQRAFSFVKRSEREGRVWLALSTDPAADGARLVQHDDPRDIANRVVVDRAKLIAFSRD